METSAYLSPNQGQCIPVKIYKHTVAYHSFPFHKQLMYGFQCSNPALHGAVIECIKSTVKWPGNFGYRSKQLCCSSCTMFYSILARITI